ncbi:hypothetical protein A2U01_0099989, partial [Trifolium medium]|nr:hypothetical protein [Trifolium medium]
MKRENTEAIVNSTISTAVETVHSHENASSFCFLHRRNSLPLLWLCRLASVSEESCISQQ